VYGICGYVSLPLGKNDTVNLKLERAKALAAQQGKHMADRANSSVHFGVMDGAEFAKQNGKNSSDLIFDTLKSGINRVTTPKRGLSDKVVKGMGVVAETAKGLGAVGLVGLLGAGVVGGVTRAMQIQNSKNKILSNPEFAGADKKTVSDYFDVISTYSPSTAANPIVAGNLVGKMVQFGGVDHKLVQDLATIQKSTDSDMTKSVDTLVKYKSPGYEELMKSEQSSNPFFG